jgi:hypothetical protein
VLVIAVTRKRVGVFVRFRAASEVRSITAALYAWFSFPFSIPSL